MEMFSREMLFLLLAVAAKATAFLLCAALIARLWVRTAALVSLLWGATLAALLVLPLVALWQPGPSINWDRGHLAKAVQPEQMKAETAPSTFAAPWSLFSTAERGISTNSVPRTEQNHTLPWATILVGLYLAGATFSLSRIAISIAYAGRLRRDAKNLPDGEQRLRAWCRLFALKQSIKGAISTQISTPAVVGWQHPLVLIPEAFLHGPDKDQHLDAAFAHELAHLKRGDHLWNLLGLLAVSLYWFHPLVHLAQRRWREASEQACDDWAVLHLGDARAYGKALLAATARLAPIPAALRLDMARRYGVAERIERILDQQKPEPYVGKRMAAFIALATTVGAVCIGGVHAEKESSEDPSFAVNKQDIVHGIGKIPISEEGKESLFNPKYFGTTIDTTGPRRGIGVVIVGKKLCNYSASQADQILASIR